MNLSEKFRREMEKLGLGVSIQINDNPPITVTSYCENCKHVSKGDPDLCLKCGAPLTSRGDTDE